MGDPPLPTATDAAATGAEATPTEATPTAAADTAVPEPAIPEVTARLRVLPGSTRFTPAPAPTLERPSRVVALHPHSGRTARAA